MFWGLVLEPSKKYTQKVEQSFHISQATLELKSADLEPVQVILEFQGSNFILATLSKKHTIFQVPLDLNFEVGDQISFRTIGKARVHLTGYHVIDDDLQALMQGEDEDSEGEEEEDDDDEEEEEESSFNDTATPGKRKKALTKSNEKKKKKLDASNEDQDEDEDTDSDDDSFDPDTTFGETTLFGDEEDSDLEDESGEEEEDDDDDDDDDEDLDEEEEDESEEETVPTPKSDKKKKENQVLNASVNGISSAKKDKKNKFKTEAGSPKNETPKKDGLTPKKDKQGKTPKQEGSQKKTPKSEKGLKQEPKTPNSPTSPVKRVLEGGVVVEDIVFGEGPVAKPGKIAQVYYQGRLKSNNKVFDSATQGPGFRFRLGKGEVIKGWDIGVNGMKVGGRRRIVIPSPLAYGAKGSPPAIPPNSTLIFEVELKGVN